METLFDALSRELGRAWKPHRAPHTPRAYRCRCGRAIFFRNSRCLGCGAELGYEPARMILAALEPVDAAPAAVAGAVRTAPSEAPPLQWRLHGDTADAPLLQRCANFDSAAGCNWMVEAADAHRHQGLCRACRLNRFIPHQSDPFNREAWSRIENAKRRLVSSLLGLGLPVRSRLSEDPQRGLAFDFLRSPPEGPRVVTGHVDGVITLDVEEADDARREALRHELREPYRTLLGHLRHEVGHYYWDRLVRDGAWLESFRALFGDERADYAAALARNYEHGPPADWATRHVSAYASAHPWEDWAESWAHYLHMVDTMDTALSFGLEADNVELSYEPFTRAHLWRTDDPGADGFLGFVNAWIELTGVLNELSRSMGQPDFYPFVLPHAAVRKLHFIHCVVRDAAQG